jgi:hypothetical protein
MTHLLPANRSDLTECCHRPIADLPDGHDLTDDPDLVTCPEMR